MIYILITLGIIFDTVLSLYIPITSYFMPLLTITNIYIIYNSHKEKEYFITIAIMGLIYDLINTNLLFYHLVIFLTLAYITKIINKNFKQNSFNLLIYLSIIIIIYELLNMTILSIYNKNIFSAYNLFNKISHSLFLNQIYALIIYNKIKNKHKNPLKT